MTADGLTVPPRAGRQVGRLVFGPVTRTGAPRMADMVMVLVIIYCLRFACKMPEIRVLWGREPQIKVKVYQAPNSTLSIRTWSDVSARQG